MPLALLSIRFLHVVESTAFKMSRGACILVLIAFSAYVTKAAEATNILDAHRTCFEEYKLITLPSGDFVDALANDRKLKCISACIWREMGWLNEDNSLNVTRRIEYSPDMAADQIQLFNECAVETDPDVCERVHKFYACLQNKNVKVHGSN